MKCNNCGAQMRGDEEFCPVCGQKAESQNSSEMKQKEENGYTGGQAVTPSTQDSGKPRKSRGFKVGIVVALVAILAVGTVAAAAVAGMIKKAVMSPAEYYRQVETDSRDRGEELFLGYYDKLRENFTGDSYAKDIKMKLTASDTAKSLLSLTGIDISGVKNLELNMLTGREGRAYSNQMMLRGNDKDLLTVKMYMDLDDKKAYYQIPELSKSYLDMSSVLNQQITEGNLEDGDIDADGEGIDEEVFSANAFSSLTSMYDFDKILVPTDNVKEIYERYTDLLIKSAENVKKSEGGCEAEGVSQKADKYTVTIDNKEFAGLAKELLNTLKEDKTIGGIIEKMDKEAYEEYKSAIEERLKAMNETTEDELSAVMDVQIDGSDRIIGRKITLSIKEGSEKKEVVLDMRSPKDGDNFGVVFAVQADGEEIMNLHGKGTEKAGVINGEFTLDSSLDNTGNELLSAGKLLKVTMEDYDMSKYAEGKVSGTVTYATEAISSLANYSLKIESEGDMEESSGKISILAGKEPFVMIDFTMKSDAKLEQIKPSASDKIYDITDNGDMTAYQSEIDIIKLLGDVQEKLDLDLSGMFGAFLGGMSDLSENPLDIGM